MQLTFLYSPVTDLSAALTFYRDTLGWTEAWREGESAAALELPGSEVQVMVAQSDEPAGPIFLVDSVEKFLAERDGLTMRVPAHEIPDGHMAGFEDPAGNVFYVLDQTGAA